MFIYPIYNHNWRNISTIYIYIYTHIYIYITRLAWNEIFSPSNKIHREVGRAKDLSAPLYFWMCLIDITFKYLLHYEPNYKACPVTKDTSRVGREGYFLCLLWQHYRRPWSFTCEPCSLNSSRTSFVWVRRVWNDSADPKSRQIRGAFHHTISQRKSERPAEIHKHIVAVYGNVMNRQNVTKWCRELSEGRTDDDNEV